MLSVLIPILTAIGAPILKSLIADKVGGAAGDVAGVVVDTIAGKLGVEKTPEAIADAYTKDPGAVTAVVQSVEATCGQEWLQQALAGRDKLLEREDSKGWFSWAWRPAMSWLLIWLWLWNCFLLPLVNAATHGNIQGLPYETLIAFTGVWLTIYGGGHTLKSVFGK